MSSNDPFSIEDPAKRAQLMKLLCGGALSSMPVGIAQAFWFGSSSRELAEDRSIATLKGEVLVNGTLANKKTRIHAGDTVRTGDKSEIIFAVGKDSFLMHANSELEISGADYFIKELRLLTGRLLSVFGNRQAEQPLNLTASTATIGIRGTGVYLEVEPDLTYLCTCYGQVALSSNTDPNDSELISAIKHEGPRYISNKPSKGTRIRPAPIIDHTDAELILLEAIVGRDPPKSFLSAYSRE
ncbi:MAG: hypothetical protein ACI9LO_003046 [Planctomycetota bacterium]|jgi:hypothetical protein